MAIESPAYEVVEQDGAIELRAYAGHLVARVVVQAAGYDEAASAGFSALADYIFGNNTAAGSIPMTAPVTTERTRGERIPMTVPVTSERDRSEHLQDAPALCTVRCPGEYAVTFSMPSRYRSLEDLPRPNNPRVTLELVPAHLAAVERFSGTLKEEAVANAVAHVQEWIEREGLTAVGEPVAGQYDAPWKPWFARHNEVLIPVERTR